MNNNQSLTVVWSWKVKIPLKVSCFTWPVIRRARFTSEVLQRKGLQICSRCYMCGQETNVNDHQFLHCKTDVNLWNMFLCMLG
uniref:Putative ovule protein n=1 Tax=Solanum chacoense TaxID=4108 RepID=A0A0V0H785_SOLCH